MSNGRKFKRPILNNRATIEAHDAGCTCRPVRRVLGTEVHLWHWPSCQIDNEQIDDTGRKVN